MSAHRGRSPRGERAADTLLKCASLRIEGKIAVVIADDDRTFDVPRSELPKGSREGTVLRAADEPDWSKAEIDEAEGRRRLERSRETLRRLGETDPGGDIDL
ncbi:MAG: DUF3006 domain-containing protein [Myxococcales bacterium]